MKKQGKARIGNIIKPLLIGLITFAVLFVLILMGITPDQYDIHIGQPAGKAIYATKDVEDTVTTELMREAAAEQVEPSYKSVDTSVNVLVQGDLQNMFLAIAGIRSEYAGRTVDDDLLAEINESAPVVFTNEELVSLFDCDETYFDTFCSDCVREVRDLMNSTLPEGQEASGITRIARGLTADGYPAALISIGNDVMRACIRPNMLIDTEITEANRERARENVEPEILVKREIIVREGEIVTEAQYRMIASLGLLKDDTLDIPLMCGLAIIVLLMCVAIAMYLVLYRPAILRDSRKLLLLCIILVLEIGISLLVRSLHSYLMPVAMASILIFQLIDGKTSLFVSCVLSLLVSMIVTTDGLFSSSMFSIILMGFTAGPIASAMLTKYPLRGGALLTGLLIGAANFAICMGVSLISSVNLQIALTSSLWAFGNGILSSVLAVGLQALFEWLFNLATNPKLIELSNPNHPLLRRLMFEAPGTYHHSIIVANLAEAGASAIGANGLLSRVGAYYHDVGKLKRPMYFKENQMGDNPHDRTDPRVSAAILTAHTRDGVQLAAKEHLPEPILDIIRQHHGDTPVVYFYDKAVKQYGDNVDPSAFRYEGPRPNTKEAAIVMLADTVEAATRTLNDPSREKVEALIHKLINGKLEDGQMSHCPLSFNDIDVLSSTFATVLSGVFHERIEYPEVSQMPPRTDVEGETEAASEKADEEEKQ